MGWLLLLLLLIAGPVSAAEFRFHGPTPLPDATATPGQITAVPLARLCTVGYTKTVRSVPASVANTVFKDYGITEAMRHRIVKGKKVARYEIDHLCSLELCGTNDISNLWPQLYAPKPGAREKDVMESFFHRAICGRAMTCQQACAALAEDWVAAYATMKRGGYSTGSAP